KRTLLIGSRMATFIWGAEAEDAVRSVGRTSADSAMTDLLEKAAKADIFYVINPQAPGYMDMASMGAAMLPAAMKPTAHSLSGVRAVGIWANVSTDIEFAGQLIASDANTAQTMMNDGKKQLDALKSNPAGMPKELVDSLTISAQDKNVSFSGKI